MSSYLHCIRTFTLVHKTMYNTKRHNFYSTTQEKNAHATISNCLHLTVLWNGVIIHVHVYTSRYALGSIGWVLCTVSPAHEP